MAVGMISIIMAALFFTFSDWLAFEMRLMKASFIPITLVPVVKWTVPASQILIIGWLLHPSHYRKAWLASIILHGGISLYFLLLLSSSDGPPCGCKGIFPSLSIHQHLVLQLFLLGLSIILFLMKTTPKPLSPFRLPSEPPVS